MTLRRYKRWVEQMDGLLRDARGHVLGGQVTTETQLDVLLGRLLAQLEALEQELSTLRAEQQAMLSGAHLQSRKLLCTCGLRNEGTV